MIFLGSMLCFEFLSAGNQQDSEHRTVYLNSANESYKFEVLTENKSIKTDKRITYYWFAFNTINSTMGGFSGKILDGSYSCFYLSNTLKEKGMFKKGLKNGEWRAWNENGALKEIINYKHGIKCGVNEIYSTDGKLLTKKEYKNDLLDGKYIQYNSDSIVYQKKFLKGIEIKEKPKKLQRDTRKIDQSTDTMKLDRATKTDLINKSKSQK